MKQSIINYMFNYAKSHLDLSDQNCEKVTLKLSKTYSIELDNEIILDFLDMLKKLEDVFVFYDGIDKERKIDEFFSFFTESQNDVNQRFWEFYKNSPTLATKYLFQLGKNNRYIQSDKISKNRSYFTEDIIVTINLSKEEKDNKAILRALLEKPQTFPPCVLCYENIGYLGKGNQAPRGTLRVAEMKLQNQNWFLQYSPYPYFDEHAIFIDKIHRPMAVDRLTIAQLFDIIEIFPEYFIGSNAALPIVGGSILSHAHFQGGKNIMFPMMKAKSISTLSSKKYPNLKIETIEWPATVLRITGKNREEVIDFVDHSLSFWENYEQRNIHIKPKTDQTKHHAIAPILYSKDKNWIVHVVFRSNITDLEYPDGRFHAHPEYHHIKKEGIGLIEAMGMFILPGRLAPVMDQFVKIKNQNDLVALSKVYPMHEKWIMESFKSLTYKESEELLKHVFIESLRQVCLNILDNIAVFKNTKEGNFYKHQFFKALLDD
jgi:UDPglucose--hexose-1-phosphate uridylyltransferase